MREIRHDELLELMRVRYDFYSARAVLERAVADAGLPEKACYPPAEVRLIAGQIATRSRDRVEELVAGFRLKATAAEGVPEPRAKTSDKSAGEKPRAAAPRPRE